MKKLFILMSLICMLSACSRESEEDWPLSTFDSVNNLEGVTLSVKQSSVSSTGLTIMIANRTNDTFTYGEFFSLEKNVNGNWAEVPVKVEENYGFNDIGFNVEAKQIKEWQIHWEWLYGELTTGDYRIIKEVIKSNETTGTYSVYPLAAEFVVK